MIGYSSDGVNWTAKQVTGMWLYGVAYGNGKYIAVGGNESISYICYSTDDVNWTTKQVSCRYLYGATYGNGKYIVMGDGGSSSRRRNDPETLPEYFPQMHGRGL